MKTKILLLFLFVWAEVVFGQISKFKERQILFVYKKVTGKNINTSQDKNNKNDFIIYFVDNKNKKDEVISSDYDKNSNFISRTIKEGKVLDWDKKQILTFEILAANGVTLNKNDTKVKLKANIKAEKSRLYIYPWDFYGTNCNLTQFRHIQK
ncbi:MAG: hypothetical protein WCJ72_19730 [Chryseobacterium sp.]